jgi:hypothetical protein
MSQHNELPMDPHGSSALVGAIATNTSVGAETAPQTGAAANGLTTDLVLDVSGTPSDAGFDEIPAEALEEQAPSAPVAAPADEEKKDEDEEEGTGVGFLPPSTTVRQDHEVFFPLEGEWNDAGVFLVGQADTQERTQKALEALPNLDLTGTESGREWVDYQREAINIAPNKDQWRDTVDREGSLWLQTIESERGKINMGALNFKNVGEGKVAGEKAVLQVRALAGLGSVIQVPLWHSGFHVTIKAPGDTAQINLNNRMMDEKIVIGRTTNGLAFANTSSFMTGWILDFVMQYVYDTSLQVKDPVVVRSMIQAADLPILFWGLACAIWPRGFQYARPYLDPKTKEQKLLKQKLSVGKLLWVDTKSLTARQISHMGNRSSGSMSVDMVKRYRDDFLRGQPRKVQLTKDIAVTLRAPSGDEYVKAGYDWIGEITKTVDEAFALEPGDGRRADFIVQQGKATSMRQYTHYVETIHAGRAEIVDRETIESTLNELSGDDDLRSTFFNEVQKFIDDKTIALIATPAAVQEEENSFPKFPHLLPLNVEHTFFTLLEQKAIRISQRL